LVDVRCWWYAVVWVGATHRVTWKTMGSKWLCRVSPGWWLCVLVMARLVCVVMLLLVSVIMVVIVVMVEMIAKPSLQRQC